MLASADSVVSIQPVASSMLDLYLSLALIAWRRPMAWAVPNGLSDGRVISLPEEALPCVRASLSEIELRSDSTLRWTIPVVMRLFIRDPPVRSD